MSTTTIKTPRVLSPAALAAMKAGRERKRAERAALAAAPTPERVAELVALYTPPAAPVKQKRPRAPLTPEHLAAMKAGRIAARALKLAAGPSEAEPAKRERSSSAASTEAEPKRKRVLSPEHLAKMKAGRMAALESKKAAAAAASPVAEAAAVITEAKPKRVLSPEHLAKMKAAAAAARAAKKAAKLAASA